MMQQPDGFYAMSSWSPTSRDDEISKNISWGRRSITYLLMTNRELFSKVTSKSLTSQVDDAVRRTRVSVCDVYITHLTRLRYKREVLSTLTSSSHRSQCHCFVKKTLIEFAKTKKKKHNSANFTNTYAEIISAHDTCSRLTCASGQKKSVHFLWRKDVCNLTQASGHVNSYTATEKCTHT